jgi:hypothetical protein
MYSLYNSYETKGTTFSYPIKSTLADDSIHDLLSFIMYSSISDFKNYAADVVQNNNKIHCHCTFCTIEKRTVPLSVPRVNGGAQRTTGVRSR